MRTFAEIRKANEGENSIFAPVDMTPVQLSPEEFREARKQYEEFVKPVSRRVFERQVSRGNL
jgi:hypothetical protein